MCGRPSIYSRLGVAVLPRRRKLCGLLPRTPLFIITPDSFESLDIESYTTLANRLFIFNAVCSIHQNHVLSRLHHDTRILVGQHNGKLVRVGRIRVDIDLALVPDDVGDGAIARVDAHVENVARRLVSRVATQVGVAVSLVQVRQMGYAASSADQQGEGEEGCDGLHDESVGRSEKK